MNQYNVLMKQILAGKTGEETKDKVIRIKKDQENGKRNSFIEELCKLCNPSYEEAKLIDIGGESIVFLVFHSMASRKQILKIQLPNLDKIAQKRFLGSVEIQCKVQNEPEFPTVYDVRKKPNFIAMEYIKGCTLRKYIEKNKDKYNNEFLIPIEERLRIWCKIANTIRKLHQNGIIHRDIKPENTIIGIDGKIKTIDFGIAKDIKNDKNLTVADRALGTAFYLPIEQYLNAKEADERSDIYQLGKLLYYIIVGDDDEFDAEKIPHEIKPIIKKALMAEKDQSLKVKN